MQGLLLEIEISEIVVHEADEPNALVDFLDAKLLAGQHRGDIDPLAMQAEPVATMVTTVDAMVITFARWKAAISLSQGVSATPMANSKG